MRAVNQGIIATFSAQDAAVLIDMLAIYKEKINKTKERFIVLPADNVAGEVIIVSPEIGEFNNFGIEINCRGINGGQVEVFTSNTGVKAGLPIISEVLGAGDSDNIIQYNGFSHVKAVICISGVTSGTINGITLCAKV